MATGYLSSFGLAVCHYCHMLYCLRGKEKQFGSQLISKPVYYQINSDGIIFLLHFNFAKLILDEDFSCVLVTFVWSVWGLSALLLRAVILYWFSLESNFQYQSTVGFKRPISKLSKWSKPKVFKIIYRALFETNRPIV